MQYIDGLKQLLLKCKRSREDQLHLVFYSMEKRRHPTLTLTLNQHYMLTQKPHIIPVFS